MPYNEKIADIVRGQLPPGLEIQEKKMYGGLVFMVNGKMCICVGGSEPDVVMVRVDKDLYPELLKRRGAVSTIMRGREIKGYIQLDSSALSDIEFWVGQALDFNKKLITESHH